MDALGSAAAHHQKRVAFAELVKRLARRVAERGLVLGQGGVEIHTYEFLFGTLAQRRGGLLKLFTVFRTVVARNAEQCRNGKEK